VDPKKGKPTLGIRDLIPAWPVVRQLGSDERFALGGAVAELALTESVMQQRRRRQGRLAGGDGRVR
jgi:hypothetical protein